MTLKVKRIGNLDSQNETTSFVVLHNPLKCCGKYDGQAIAVTRGSEYSDLRKVWKLNKVPIYDRIPSDFRVEGLTLPSPCALHAEGCHRPSVARIGAILKRQCVLKDNGAPAFRGASQKFDKFISNFVSRTLQGIETVTVADEFEATFGRRLEYPFPECGAAIKLHRGYRARLRKAWKENPAYKKYAQDHKCKEVDLPSGSKQVLVTDPVRKELATLILNQERSLYDLFVKGKQDPASLNYSAMPGILPADVDLPNPAE